MKYLFSFVFVFTNSGAINLPQFKLFMAHPLHFQRPDGHSHNPVTKRIKYNVARGQETGAVEDG